MVTARLLLLLGCLVGAHAETLEWQHAGSVLHLNVEVRPPPAASRGVLLFVPGYMNTVGEFEKVLQWFSRQGWTVVALELPGHGRSEGARFDIDAFSDYGDAVTACWDWINQQPWPGPRVALAFSLGAAALFEALNRPQAPPLDRVVFCAPLLRTDWYSGLSVVNHLVTPWASGLYSADLRARAHWFSALDRWLVALEHQIAPVALRLTVFSGDRDQVVDEGANRRLLERLVPGLSWVTLPGRNHWFLMGDDPELFRTVSRAFDGL